MDDKTIRAPSSGNRRSMLKKKRQPTQEELERDLSNCKLHDGTIRLASTAEIQRVVSDLEFNSSALPSYSDADKFGTLGRIHFDADFFNVAPKEEQPKQTVVPPTDGEPKTPTREDQMKKPLPPPPAAALDDILPSSFSPSSRHRAQTDFNVLPAFTAQPPNVNSNETTKIPKEPKMHPENPFQNQPQQPQEPQHSQPPHNPMIRENSSPVFNTPTPTTANEQKKSNFNPAAANAANKNLANIMQGNRNQQQQQQQHQQHQHQQQPQPQQQPQQQQLQRPDPRNLTHSAPENSSIPSYARIPTSSTSTHSPQPQAQVQAQVQPQVQPQTPQTQSQGSYVPAYLSNTKPTPATPTAATPNQTGNLYQQAGSVVPGRQYNPAPSNTNSINSQNSYISAMNSGSFQNPQQLPSVPIDWEAKYAPNGRLFFLDHTEKTTHWAPPPGWAIRKTKEGKLYYVHHPTKSTHWRLPPQGWEICKLPDGRIFFVDHVNKQTSWTLPS